MLYCILGAYTFKSIQRGDVLTRSIFSNFLTTGTPWLARLDETWGVCCEIQVWFQFWWCHCNAVCNIATKWICVAAMLGCIWDSITFYEPYADVCTRTRELNEAIQWIQSSVGRVKAWCLIGDRTRPGSMMAMYYPVPGNEFQWNYDKHTSSSFIKIRLKISPTEWRPHWIGLDML